MYGLSKFRNVVFKRSVSTLLVVEQKAGIPSSTNANALAAASKLGFPITALVSGSESSVEAAAALVMKYPGVTKVLKAKGPEYEHELAEPMADLLATVSKNHSHVVAAHSGLGKNVIPRAGALLDVSPIADVVSIESGDTFKRPIYAGNAIATVKSADSIKLITIRPTAFDAVKLEGGSASAEDVKTSTSSPTKWISEQIAKSDRPELGAAKVVVAGGRALKSKENFDKLIFTLADKMKAGVGASRAACDAGYCAHDMQVGQTGKIVAPEVYIAIGISGAIQHLAGMKDSKLIVAINNDADAPIFPVADVGLVADLFEAVPELTSKI